jgi:hypothetical protein
MHGAIVLVAVSLAQAAPVPPGETFPGIQYLEGHPALGRKKTKGALLLDARGVRFLGKDGRPVFTLPIESIREASSTTLENEYPAPPDPRDLLALSTSGIDGAGVVVFRTPRWQARAIAAKVNFYRQRSTPPTP